MPSPLPTSHETAVRSAFQNLLSTPGVQVLDPCTGTGNFIVNILRRISGSTLATKYANDLFCNEIMLLPYYIASLNIEHAYYERAGDYKPFEGICFADTLELAEGQQPSLFVEQNTERVTREKAAPIMVVIGNPPYNVGQERENDNNKNRRYPIIDGRINKTYAKDSRATLNTKLYDAYVKFFRWATDRLQGRDGIVCYVSNNSFIDQIAFDGMRKHLLQDFNQIYHLDLHGNVRKNPKLSGTTHNVFGIQVGVGITIAVRSSLNPTRKLYYYRVPEFWRKIEKLAFISAKHTINEIEWEELKPDDHYTWLTKGLHDEFSTFLPLATKEAKSSHQFEVKTLFKTYSLGINTARDSVVYDFNYHQLATRVEQFIEDYNAEISRWVRSGRTKDIGNTVSYDKVQWSRNLKRDLRNEHYTQFDTNAIRKSLYRPFSKLWLYYADILIDERGTSGIFLPISNTNVENSIICLTNLGSEKPFMVLITDTISDLHLVGAGAGSQCFPYYTYAKDGSNRRENITDWALAQFQAHYGADVSKHDIFQHVYAMLHHPQYRERYAENLKRELPRLPLLQDAGMFATCVRIGKCLMALHLRYEEAAEYPLTWLENKDVPINWRVEKMRLNPSKDTLIVNEWLTLTGIPQACFQYKLGNRSALEWVIDQYQVSTDTRSGITSDPNRLDNERYIVQLLGKVVTVSVETVQLVEELARAVQQEAWMGEIAAVEYKTTG